jgi:ketosteroid isomerase-like protein
MFDSLKAVVAVPLTVVALAICGGAGQKKVVSEPATKAIRAVLDSQVQAWNRGDLEAFMQGYWRSPDLTFFSDGVTVSGWEETLGRYRKRYQSAGNEMGKLEFVDMKIELLGSGAAFVRGRFNLKMSGGDSGGLFTLTLRKLSGGWKIVHDHTSSGS